METNNNKELFFNLVSDKKSNLANELEDRVKNQGWKKESKVIAFKVLKALKENGLKQCDLAERMSVTPQQVSKIVKGQENLTLATITRLEDILNIKILHTTREGDTADYKNTYIKTSMPTTYPLPSITIDMNESNYKSKDFNKTISYGCNPVAANC